MSNRTIWSNENFRILEVEDNDFDLDMLKGECYTAEANPDLNLAAIKRLERLFEQLVEDEGVFGYILEKKCSCCESWEHVDSCFGFVGAHSEDNKHYIIKEMKGAAK